MYSDSLICNCLISICAPSSGQTHIWHLSLLRKYHSVTILIQQSQCNHIIPIIHSVHPGQPKLYDSDIHHFTMMNN